MGLIMAATELAKRQTRCYNTYSGYTEDCNSNWYDWGRWVVLAGVIVVAVFIFLVISCFSARRRKRQGAAPFYGTGWLATTHGPVNYYGPNGANRPGQQQWPQQQQQQQYGNNGAYAPPYSPPSNQGYYGQQQNGVDLPELNNSYQPQRGGDYVYAPPSGPPPSKGGKGSRVVR